MYRNHLTVGFRSLIRQKALSAINIAGLSLAIACLLLIFLFIKDERSFDSFHGNADSIYRVIDCMKQIDEGSIPGKAIPTADSMYQFVDYMRRPGEGVIAGTVVPTPLGPTLKEWYPQIGQFVRFLWPPAAVIRRDDRVFGENIRCVDSNFFQMFSFPLVMGDSVNALKNPYSIVITEEVARKYFGDENPIGKRLSVSLGGESSDYTVTAVAKEPPANSTIHFSVLIPIERDPDYQRLSSAWNSSSCLTYVQIKNPQDAQKIEEMSPAFLSTMKGHMTPYSMEGKTPHNVFFLGFQSLKDIYMNPSGEYGLSGRSSPERSYILMGIALLILLMACINFTTLAIGRSASRVPEIGTRKALGASRFQLARQFLTETQLLSLFAMIVGVALAELLVPVFNSLSGKQLAIGLFSNPQMVIILLVLAVTVGLLAGVYPALAMSKLGAAEAIRRRSLTGGKSHVMRALVVLQFALSVFLVTSTAIMASQMSYIQNKDLGYNSEQLIAIPTYTGWNSDGELLLARFKNRVESLPAVLGVTGMDYSFSMGYDQEGWMDEGVTRKALAYRVDPDFISTVGAKLIEGRDFSSDLSTDAIGAVIVNESLVKEFGIRNPVGSRLGGWGRDVMRDSIDPMIVGVVKDIHFGSLRSNVQPAVLHMNPKMPMSNILVRISPENMQSTLGTLENVWADVAPDTPFDYSFVDEQVAAQYRDVVRWEKIVGYSSAFAIIIACLGLFGLASFAVERRTREIGIRKVLGATVSGIAAMISKEFLILVVISNLIAWPLAFYFMRNWLQNFAYRTSLGIGTFLASGVFAIVIAMIAVSAQAVRAARTDPVQCLKHE